MKQLVAELRKGPVNLRDAVTLSHTLLLLLPLPLLLLLLLLLLQLLQPLQATSRSS
jgi:hypothetical protein